MLSETTSTESGSNPSRTSRTFRRLRTNNPAPTSSTTDERALQHEQGGAQRRERWYVPHALPI